MASMATTHDLSVEDIVCKNPGPKPPVSAYDSMMTIKVVETVEGEIGEPDATVTKDFPVYRGLLCFHSDFFNNALNGPFKEGGSVIYTVTDCSIRTFTLFFNWMNAGVVSLGMDEEHSPAEIDEIDAVLLYVFADFYAIPALKNGALGIYLMTAAQNSVVEFRAIHTMYEHTPESSLLKKLVLDVLVDTWEFNVRDLEQECTQSAKLGTDLWERCWSRQVVPWSELCNGFSERLDWERDMVQHFCERYHDHTEAGVDSKKKA